jgi:hypothetical protein
MRPGTGSGRAPPRRRHRLEEGVDASSGDIAKVSRNRVGGWEKAFLRVFSAGLPVSLSDDLGRVELVGEKGWTIQRGAIVGTLGSLAGPVG